VVAFFVSLLIGGERGGARIKTGFAERHMVPRPRRVRLKPDTTGMVRLKADTTGMSA